MNQFDQVLAAIRDGHTTSMEISGLMDISQAAATTCLCGLHDLGLIEPVGKRRYTNSRSGRKAIVWGVVEESGGVK